MLSAAVPGLANAVYTALQIEKPEIVQDQLGLKYLALIANFTYKERPRFFFLYLSRYRVIAIPKRVFESPEALDTFRGVLRDALPYYKKRA